MKLKQILKKQEEKELGKKRFMTIPENSHILKSHSGFTDKNDSKLIDSFPTAQCQQDNDILSISRNEAEKIEVIKEIDDRENDYDENSLPCEMSTDRGDNLEEIELPNNDNDLEMINDFTKPEKKLNKGNSEKKLIKDKAARVSNSKRISGIFVLIHKICVIDLKI